MIRRRAQRAVRDDSERWKASQSPAAHPDNCMVALWETANSVPGYCEPGIRMSCDQWWSVVISCEHGEFRGLSQGQLDPSSAFLSALGAYRDGHAPLLRLGNPNLGHPNSPPGAPDAAAC